MILAVQTSIACCTGCHASYNHGEYMKLVDAPTTVRADETIVTQRECDQCGTLVGVADFAGMNPAGMWRRWDLYVQAYPDTRRQPVMIPETRADRVQLWWMRRGADCIVGGFILSVLLLVLWRLL